MGVVDKHGLQSGASTGRTAATNYSQGRRKQFGSGGACRPVLSIITSLPTILGAERQQAAADGAKVLLL